LKTLRIYIVEDEPLITVNIKFALKKEGIKVVGNSDEYDIAMKEIKNIRPTLVLLDIKLQGEKDGVDIAIELEKENINYLYLTSQADPITLSRVKQTQPLGYIVKPFTEAGLLSNIELAWHKINLSNDEFITVKSKGITYKINQATIQYLKAFDNYCYIYTSQEKYLIAHTLKYISEKLNPDIFLKTHRSYIVNSQKISSIRADKVIIDQHEIPLSSSNKESILKKLEY